MAEVDRPKRLAPGRGYRADRGFLGCRGGAAHGSARATVGSCGQPALSPDGTRLLYTDERGFHLLDLSTAQDSLLGVDGHAPIWSSDGPRILFVSLPGLRVMRADGSEAQQ